MFQSTHPVWDATQAPSYGGYIQMFQSTHPVWDATPAAHQQHGSGRFQSTHPVWDATHPRAPGYEPPDVSIHASRMGCDRQRKRSFRRRKSFNPRIPYGMRRVDWSVMIGGMLFQSTHPVWDATSWKLTVDGQWCSCRFAPTCSSCCYFQVRSFYSNDVNVLKSRLYENRRSAGNFL